MKIKIFSLTFIILFIGIGLYFFKVKRNVSNQNKKSLKIKTEKMQVSAKNKDIVNDKNRQKAIDEYLNTLRQKIDENFPIGLVQEDAISHCISKLFRKKNKSIVPKGALVKILNFSRLKKIKPERNRLQILYKGNIYCILQKKVRKKDKIIVIEGGVAETSIYFRYVLFPNGKFFDMVHRIHFYPNDWNYEYIAGIGTYTKTKNTIKLCDYENFLYPYSNFPKGIKCMTLKREEKKWKYTEGNRMITYGLYEY